MKRSSGGDIRRIPKSERRERRLTSLFLIPSLAGVLLFFVLPFAVVIYYSLIDNPVGQNFVGIDNYIRLIGNSAFQMAVKNTAMFSAMSVPLAVILALLLAMILDTAIPAKSIFRTIFLSPMMVPTASIVLIWQVIFHYNGAANEMLGIFGLAPIDWFKSAYSQFAIVLLFLWKNVGYNMILFMAALGSIPHDVLESATIDGAGPFSRFFSIKLRYLSSSILFVGILSLINSFKVFREVYLLTGDYPFDTLYLLQHFMNNTINSLDYQKLSTAAVLMGIALVIIIGLMFFIDDRVGKDLEE